MATKVSLENNILKIDNGVKILYYVASWCDMDFTATTVIIADRGRTSYSSVEIPFTDFQDGNATSIATEVLIATYLSDKIG